LAQGLHRQLAPIDQWRTERRLPAGQPEQIGRDPHLAVAVVAGTDADHRNRELAPQAGSQRGRHMLQHQGEAAGRLQIPGLAPQPFLADRIVRLAPVAQLVHRLGGETEVPHHRHATAHQPVHHLHGFRLTAFQLHRRRLGFLQHPAGGSHGQITAALITEKGQITDHHGPLRRSAL